MTKLPPPTEHQECVTLVNYLKQLKVSGEVLLFAHIINEFKFGPKMMGYIMTAKAAGWVSGVPDYIIVTKTRILFLEMKRQRLGVVSPEQKEWLQCLDSKQTVSGVAKGFSQAKEWLDSQLETTKGEV